MDYYSILGVAKNASEQDIRKAYKKQSMQHHPDRGGSEEQFKKINEAYSTLKDPAKRQQYDNPQPQYNFNTSNMGGNFEDMFSQMFSQGRRQQRNQDIRIKVELTLKEVFTGKSLIAAYRIRSGQEQSVNLDIPSGVKDNDTIRFHELGDSSLPGRRGDLFVVIKIKNDPFWTRTNNDLTTIAKINCLDLILGTKYVINTLDDRSLEVNIPPGTKNNTTFSMHGLGIPDVKSSRRGNLFVKVDAVIPQDLNEEQLNKIKEIVNGSTASTGS